MLDDIYNKSLDNEITPDIANRLIHSANQFQLFDTADNLRKKINGDVVTFENGNLVECFERVPNGSISIDGKSSDDVGELVLKDREMLSNNGIIIISATLDKRSKKILCGPEILTRGFIYVKDSLELVNNIKEICINIIDDFFILNFDRLMGKYN